MGGVPELVLLVVLKYTLGGKLNGRSPRVSIVSSFEQHPWKERGLLMALSPFGIELCYIYVVGVPANY